MKNYFFFLSILLSCVCCNQTSTNNQNKKTDSISQSKNDSGKKNYNQTDSYPRRENKILSAGKSVFGKSHYVIPVAVANHFLEEGKSIIDFYRYQRKFQDNEETVALYFFLFDSASGWKNNIELVADAIKADKQLKSLVDKTPVPSKYEGYRKGFSKLIAKAIECFQYLHDFGNEGKQFKKGNEEYQVLLDKNTTLFFKLFDSENFIPFDSAIVKQLNDETDLIKYNTENTVDSLQKKNQPYQAFCLLNETSIADSFQLDKINMTCADLLLKQKFYDLMDKHFSDKDSVGIWYLENILNSNRYSPFLALAWIEWRCTLQSHAFGNSKGSEIPNSLYDEKRFHLMELLLKYFGENPKDTWAAMQFFMLADHEIIHRFGDYNYGNQSAIDSYTYFGE